MKHAGLRGLVRSNSGNVAILTGLLLPAVCLLIGLLFEVGRATTYVAQSKQVIALACERSTKPTRTMTPTDDVRRKNVLETFDTLVRSTKQTVTSRDATIDWLTTKLSASFKYNPVFTGMAGLKEYTYDLSYECVGIPPYPHDGEVLLTSALTKPDGTDVKLKYGQSAKSPMGCWGVYPATDFGWDSGTGSGIEVQDWSNEYCRKSQNWFGLPPAELPSKYGIELDSWNHSSMTKIIELHPGYYEFSVWYTGRRPEYEGSNEIDIILQKTRPQKLTPEKIISMAQDRKSTNWTLYKYQIEVKEYSIYSLTITAAGKDDSLGGVITSFNVKYIDR